MSSLVSGRDPAARRLEEVAGDVCQQQGGGILLSKTIILLIIRTLSSVKDSDLYCESRRQHVTPVVWRQEYTPRAAAVQEVNGLYCALLKDSNFRSLMLILNGLNAKFYFVFYMFLLLCLFVCFVFYEDPPLTLA